MSRMVVVTLPEDQVNQLEFLAKEESNRIGKEVSGLSASRSSG